jgi:[CysO sulfur-carrier protein]-S-L-cysteine hydrolase
MPERTNTPGEIPGPGNTTRRAPTALNFTAAQWQQLVDHLCAALPAEGCGLLASAETAEGEVAIARIFPGTNALASATRFRMDPAEVIDAFRIMREEGLRLAAIFHSHPTSPPTLSPTDLAEAHYPEAAIAIVSFAGAVPEAAAWRLDWREGAMAPAQIPIRVQPA